MVCFLWLILANPTPLKIPIFPNQFLVFMIDLSNALIEKDDIVVDLSMLYEMGDEEDTEVIKTIMDLFLDNMPPTLKEMQQCVDKKDWDELSKRAHYAKSSLSVVQIEKMHNIALTIEANAKHRIEVDGLPALVQQFKKHYQTAESVLKPIAAQL